MEEKVVTPHPRGKKGVNISRAKYETVKKTVLEDLGKSGLTHEELTAAALKKLRGKFKGSIPWYVESLKLKCRGVIERVPGERYEVYRVKR